MSSDHDHVPLLIYRCEFFPMNCVYYTDFLYKYYLKVNLCKDLEVFTSNKIIERVP